MGEAADETVGARRKKIISTTVTLRTQQVDYLEYIAERDEVSLSQAFREILERHAQVELRPVRRPTQKARKHFVIDEAQARLLALLAVRWGLYKSDVARRLIDEALQGDRSV